MDPMYSAEWFDAFAATVPQHFVEADVRGLASALPLDGFRRVLDVACGIGRIAGPLASAGYEVTGIDVSIEALRSARARAPGARYVALDQRDVGAMAWTFDGAIVLWNSLGFAGRSGDANTLRGLAKSLRPGGRLVLELYHPEWLASHPLSGERDERGPAVRRWLERGRLFHRIEYGSGRVDDIQFDVYLPDEVAELCASAGLRVERQMAWWDPAVAPSLELPRYQVVCEKP